MKKIYFVTTNNYKFQKCRTYFESENLDIVQLSIETPEIQAADNKTVAEYSAKWAADKYRTPVLKEDIGLYIEALSGFPGPYLNHVEKWIDTAGFLSLMANKENRNAYWEFCIAYCEPSEKPVSFSTFPNGTIAHEAKGSGGWIADKVFIPMGNLQTIAELLDEKKFKRDQSHYRALKDYLMTT